MKLKVLPSLTLTASLLISPLAISGTIGTLNWDGSSDYITDSASTTRYLQLDLLADLTYAETVTATTSGAYQNYHIASQAEGYAFYSALGGTLMDVPGQQQLSETIGYFLDGVLGDNFTSGEDRVFFRSNEVHHDLGYISLDARNSVQLDDGYTVYSSSDAWSHSGFFSRNTISWLLVSNGGPSPVPIPAAAFMFAPALLGFLGFRRKLRA